MEKIFDIAKDSEKSWGVIAQGIDSNFEEMSAKISNIGDEIGKQQIDTILDSSSIVQITYDGTMFVSSSIYGIIPFVLYRGQTATFSNIAGTTANPCAKFSAEPKEGAICTRTYVYSPYTATDDVEYLAITYNVAEGQPSPQFQLRITPYGLYKSISDIEENISDISKKIGNEKQSIKVTSKDLHAMTYDGKKFVSSESYHMWWTKLTKGQALTYTKIQGTIANGMALFSAEPKIGAECTRTYISENPYTATNDIEYVGIVYNVASSQPSPILNVDISSIGIIGNIDSLVAKYKDLKIAIFGDSVLELTDSAGMSYPQYIAKYLNTTVINGGIGGTRFVPRNYEIFEGTDQSRYDTYYNYHQLDIYSMIKAIITEDWSAQVSAAQWLKDNASDDNTAIIDTLSNTDWSSVTDVIFNAGSNDWAGGSTIGTNDSFSPDELYGVWNLIIQQLSTKYPKMRIYFVTNCVRYWSAITDEEWGGTYKNNKGVTLEDIVNDNIAICKKWSIPYYDLYHSIGWNKYNFSTFFRDFAHPTKGLDVIGHKISGFIMANWG